MAVNAIAKYLFVPCHRAIAKCGHGNNVINIALLLNVNRIGNNVLRKGKERNEEKEKYFFHVICFRGLKFFVQVL
jgi:hypothetical protein